MLKKIIFPLRLLCIFVKFNCSYIKCDWKICWIFMLRKWIVVEYTLVLISFKLLLILNVLIPHFSPLSSPSGNSRLSVSLVVLSSMSWIYSKHSVFYDHFNFVEEPGIPQYHVRLLRQMRTHSSVALHRALITFYQSTFLSHHMKTLTKEDFRSCFRTWQEASDRCV